MRCVFNINEVNNNKHNQTVQTRQKKKQTKKLIIILNCNNFRLDAFYLHQFHVEANHDMNGEGKYEHVWCS